MPPRLRRKAACCVCWPLHLGAQAGFGHLLLGPSSARRPWQDVTQFVEKPQAPETLMTQGARWNMGQFVGTAAQFMRACAEQIPATLAAAQGLVAGAQVRWEFTELPPWPETSPSISFDHAVLEKNACVAVPYTGQWQDVGTLPSWEGQQA